MEVKRKYISKVLEHLKQMCSPPHTIVVANEMAIHHLHGEAVGHVFGHPTKDPFNNARLIAVNRIVREIARDNNVSFIDAYAISSSFYPNTGHEVYAHYYDDNTLGGNAASHAVADLFWETIY
jgi:hypothetical protein